MSRRPVRLLLAAAAAVLLLAWLLRLTPWAGRILVAAVLGYVIFRFGVASLGPLRVGAKSYPPVDVVEPDGIPVYSCHGCGTQLVLLRRGNDRPPRHCGEAMTFEVVPEGVAVPDYPPDDL